MITRRTGVHENVAPDHALYFLIKADIGSTFHADGDVNRVMMKEGLLVLASDFEEVGAKVALLPQPPEDCLQLEQQTVWCIMRLFHFIALSRCSVRVNLCKHKCWS